MKITTKEWKIEGLTPLLMCAPNNLEVGPKKIKTKVVLPPDQEAASVVYQSNGKFYIPMVCFRNALLYAVSGKRVGKRSAMSIIAAAVFVATDKFLLMDHKTKSYLTKYEVDTQPVVIQKKDRVMRSRPRFDDWGGIVKFDIDTDMLAVDLVTENLNEAGLISGVGDFRVQKKGPYGRFKAVLI